MKIASSVCCWCVLLVLAVGSGCNVWRSHSYVEGVDISDNPKTVQRYWIKLVAEPSSGGTRLYDYRRCLEIYERRLPDVFSPTGLPVYVEINQSKADVAWGLDHSSAMGYLLNGLFSIGTLTVIPLHESFSSRKKVGVFLDERSKDIFTFTAKSHNERSGGWWPTAFMWPLEEPVDGRFSHGDSVVGGTTATRPEFGDRRMEESFCGDADAIVFAVAHILQRIGESKMLVPQRIIIGD